jgi:hypothetical protein
MKPYGILKGAKSVMKFVCCVMGYTICSIVSVQAWKEEVPRF